MLNFTVYETRPKFKDQNSPDGLFHRGFRKIRSNGETGFVLAQGLKFGSKDLLAHAGKWIYVRIDYYWATSANLGYDIFTENRNVLSYIKCDSI